MTKNSLALTALAFMCIAVLQRIFGDPAYASGTFATAMLFMLWALVRRHQENH